MNLSTKHFACYGQTQQTTTRSHSSHSSKKKDLDNPHEMSNPTHRKKKETKKEKHPKCCPPKS